MKTFLFAAVCAFATLTAHAQTSLKNPCKSSYSSALWAEEVPYPKEFRYAEREGKVVLKASVNECGDVDDVTVIQTSGSKQLDEAATAEYKERHFPPRYSNGEAKRFYAIVSIGFTQNRAYAHITSRPIAESSSRSSSEDIAPLSHEQAVRYMLENMQARRLIVAGMKLAAASPNAPDPMYVQFMENVFANVTDDQIYERLVPVYMKYIGRDDAISIGKFYQTATGQKIVAAMVDEATGGPKLSQALKNLSFFEYKELDDFGRSHAGGAFMKEGPKISEEMRATGRQWGMDLAQKRIQTIIREWAIELERASKSGDFNPDSIKKSDTGVVFLDQIIDATSAAAYRGTALRSEFEKDLDKLGVDALLKPADLASPDRIAENKERLRKIEERVDRFVQAMDESQQEFRDKINGISMTPKLRDEVVPHFEKGIARSYEWMIRFNENQHSLIELYKRVFAFAESRAGKVVFKDGRLVFDETADLEIYRDLMAQVTQEAKKSTDLNNEIVKTQSQFLQKLKSN